MQLDGFLSRFALRELLELSAASLVSGAIEVHAPAGTHRIFFVEGRCVHATSPTASGFDALWPLFELNDAPFRFVAGLSASERTLHEPTPQLIEQAQELAMQWLTIRPQIPHLEIVPQLTTPANGEQVRIYEEDWPVLSWVVGARTITEIAKAAILDPIEVCIGLLRLRDRGLVNFCQQQVMGASQTAEASPAPAPAAAQKPALATMAAKPTSFFARLLNDAPEELFSVPLPVAEQAASATPAEPIESEAAAPEGPTAYDDILRLLRT
jgi:hypothetical protein